VLSSQILAEDRVVSPSQDLEDPKVIEKDKKKHPLPMLCRALRINRTGGLINFDRLCR
jgi:hypothetical protein